eukprot:5378643-Alexandrium_andersonii.AAC.1
MRHCGIFGLTPPNRFVVKCLRARSGAFRRVRASYKGVHARRLRVRALELIKHQTSPEKCLKAP